ncbi:MAG: EamA family transporter [Sphingobacteriaceae bacterium]
MIYVFISIFCSVIVSILLKLAKRYELNMLQAIPVNYAIAALACIFLFKPSLSIPSQSPMGTYTLLSLLLPSLFLILAIAVKKSGIVRTDIAQRLSLLIPLLAAFLLFGEIISPQKFSAIAIGLVAVLFSIPWKNEQASTKYAWVYPLLVFIGMGIIDVFFKQLAAFKTIPFTTSLFWVFLGSLAISLVFLAYQRLIKKEVLKLKNILFGMVLGFFNFGNILFYLKAHQALNTQPSLVFTSMNIGVIALGSLVGLWVFKEKLSLLNYFGIALALLAILLISLA